MDSGDQFRIVADFVICLNIEYSAKSTAVSVWQIDNGVE